MVKLLENKIFSISEANFAEIALEVFRFQAQSNIVYKQYLDLLRVDADSINNVASIPFLPISFFKTHNVLAKGYTPERVFTSSGTTGSETSRHLVASLSLYEKSFVNTFEIFYGNPSQYCVLALLPSYLEREGSSLVYMASKLIELSNDSSSGFYLYNTSELIDKLKTNEKNGKRSLLLGVTFALLELAKNYSFPLSNTIIMETGGMKGRGKELIREEAHTIMQKSFGVKSIHSEYGMTELLSQAYSKGDGTFRCPPWMKIKIRDPYDPFSLLAEGKTGAINVIDLANLYSCSFLQTDDLGKLRNPNEFEVLGRMDGSQIRGCNLLSL
jgi:hypothetical protein